MNYIIVLILLLGSALFSGLNLGFMSLGPYELKRKMKLGDKRAEKIYSVRKKGNLLLVTLLLGNVAVNSAIAIFLGSISVGLIAGIVSTFLITIFGEILPQAFFSRFALTFGSKLVWLIKIVIFILYPICWPIATLLDKMLGEELPTLYSRKELVEMLQEHGDHNMSDLRKDEERIARGALTFGGKLVEEVMVPHSAVVHVLENQRLDSKTVAKLMKHGYTRFPVMNSSRDKITGTLYVHNLVGLKSDKVKVKDICDKQVDFLLEDENLDTALNTFLKKRRHLFIVLNQFSEYVGIVSLEDILEEIIGKEIVDEFDEYDDVREYALSHAIKNQK